jgi:hypothetical protein
MKPPACSLCKYWVFGEQWGSQEKVPPAERQGACHRHAPQPTLGDWEYIVLNLLVEIAPSYSKEELKKTYWWDRWEECRLEPCAWPITKAADWCGDFVDIPEGWTARDPGDEI